VDPAALDLFVPELYSEQARFVRFKLPSDMASKIPLDAMLKALPGLADEGYGTVDKQVFTLEALDATARQLGASYQLRIAMNPQQESQIALYILDGLIKVIQHEAERQGRPDDGKQAASTMQLARILLQNSASQMQASRTVSHLYANRQGQLLGVNQEITLDTPQLRGLAYLHLRYNNHGKPVFAYQPAASDIIDYDKLSKPQWLKQLDK